MPSAMPVLTARIVRAFRVGAALPTPCPAFELNFGVITAMYVSKSLEKKNGKEISCNQ